MFPRRGRHATIKNDSFFRNSSCLNRPLEIEKTHKVCHISLLPLFIPKTSSPASLGNQINLCSQCHSRLRHKINRTNRTEHLRCVALSELTSESEVSALLAELLESLDL